MSKKTSHATVRLRAYLKGQLREMVFLLILFYLGKKRIKKNCQKIPKDGISNLGCCALKQCFALVGHKNANLIIVMLCLVPVQHPYTRTYCIE